MRLARLAVVAGAVAALAAIPSSSLAAQPPNGNDPCVSGTRNTCGTTGVGFYGQGRYGTRWYGDYRGVVLGEAHAYCIDLRFWYPSPDYRYREVPASGLRNKEGEAIATSSLEKIAYAIWAYGRSTNGNQAAAVMLYVHSLIGDARPGELDPSSLSAPVASLLKKVSADASRFHGPYRVEVELPDSVAVGKRGTARIRVLSAAGDALPNLDLTLTASGATGVPGRVRTNANGVATVSFTAGAAGGIRLTAVTEPIASTLPRIFRPTTAKAAPNGQRVAVADTQRVSSAASSTGSKAKLSVTTTATPDTIAAGEQATDKVTISGALPTYAGTVAVRLFGPFRTTDEIACTGTPLSQTSFAAKGSGAYTTPGVKLDRPGLYVFQEVVPGDANHVGLTTPCTAPSERVRVQAAPKLQTVVSAQTTAPGSAITDRITVSGLAGEQVTISAALYGPFATRETIVCTGTPAWTGTVQATADGDLTTEPFTVTTPGYYAYAESIEAGDFVRATRTACADVAETTVVTATPVLKTRISSRQARPGVSITDRVAVSGLGALAVPVQVSLYGPFPSRSAIRCSGKPYWSGSFTARGDGTYTTAPARLGSAGYYSYRESIVGTAATAAASSACADAVETAVVRASPTASTIVSGEVVRPGAPVLDRIRVNGLGSTPVTIAVDLYGPFATRDAIRCSGRPYWHGTVAARGDGVVRTAPVRLARAGLYTFRERIAGTPFVDSFAGDCAKVAETALAAPEIVTGRGDASRFVRRRTVTISGDAPTRVRIDSLGIDAPVSPVGIDLRRGVLGVSSNIHRTGWWLDGAAPGSTAGSILIAGHVDSATQGAGSFFRLHSAKVGDRIEVTSRNGSTRTYKVVSVRSYLKAKLPTSVWSLRGRARLVLVTCGGPFVRAERHYRDNVVVTAVPA